MKKHILVVSQYFYPEQFRINDIAAEWVRRGYRVTVLTGIPNYPQGKFYKGYNWFRGRRETWNGIDIIRIPLIARGKTPIGMVLNYFSFVISGFFWKCFTKLRADYVFTFEVSPMTQALIGVWYAKKHHIPNYLYVQDLWPENVEIVTGIHTKLIIGPIGKMVDYIYRHCDKIFATSPSFVEEIRKRIPGEEEKAIYWPQYAEEFYQPSEIKSELIPEDGVFNITFTGNIGTAQGLEILPDTAKLLKESGTRVRFNIVGDGRNKENFLRQIHNLEVDDFFHLIGWQPAEAIPKILAASDIAFLSFSGNPLFSMTIPAKLQSYMACGMPILAAASGETKRIIEDAACGICCEIGDADKLADAIRHLQNGACLSDMAKRSRAYFEVHFTKKELMDEIDPFFHTETPD